jgi:predicted ArsR family transcriptional regulator
MGKRNNPSTSNDAYRSLKHSETQELYEKILWGLGQIKEGTYEDISKAIKVPKERVWKRMNELLKTGKVYRPGTKRALESGRDGFVWALTQPGQSNVPVIEKPIPGPTVADYSRKLIAKQPELF